MTNAFLHRVDWVFVSNFCLLVPCWFITKTFPFTHPIVPLCWISLYFSSSYHYFHEQHPLFSRWEPRLVKILFLVLMFETYPVVVRRIDLILWLIVAFMCYTKACGRTQTKERTWAYVQFHTYFHVVMAIFATLAVHAHPVDHERCLFSISC